MKKTMVLFTLFLSGTQLLGMEGKTPKKISLNKNDISWAWTENLKKFSVQSVGSVLEKLIKSNATQDLGLFNLNETLNYYQKNNAEQNLKYIKKEFAQYLPMLEPETKKETEKQSERFFSALIIKILDALENQNLDVALDLFTRAGNLANSLPNNKRIQIQREDVHIGIAKLSEIEGKTEQAIEIYKKYPRQELAILGLLKHNHPEFVSQKEVCILALNRFKNQNYKEAHKLFIIAKEKGDQLAKEMLGGFDSKCYTCQHPIPSSSAFSCKTCKKHKIDTNFCSDECKKINLDKTLKEQAESKSTLALVPIAHPKLKLSMPSTVQLGLDLFKNTLPVDLDETQIGNSLMNERALVLYKGSSKKEEIEKYTDINELD